MARVGKFEGPPSECRDQKRKEGEGVQGTDEYIAGLIKDLHLVVAERYVGNVEATVPVIQQILKDLKG